jgi:hypothetical protein
MFYDELAGKYDQDEVSLVVCFDILLDGERVIQVLRDLVDAGKSFGFICDSVESGPDLGKDESGNVINNTFKNKCRIHFRKRDPI